MEEVEILHEKENDNVSAIDVSQTRRVLKLMTKSELLAMKIEVRSKIARNDVALSKLDNGLEDLKECMHRMTNVIQECQNLIKVEKQESEELQRLLRDVTYPGAGKTNVVIPMVGGIPLKKAFISLKRLGPTYLPVHLRSPSESRSSSGCNRTTRNSRIGTASTQPGP